MNSWKVAAKMGIHLINELVRSAWLAVAIQVPVNGIRFWRKNEITPWHKRRIIRGHCGWGSMVRPVTTTGSGSLFAREVWEVLIHPAASFLREEPPLGLTLRNWPVSENNRRYHGPNCSHFRSQTQTGQKLIRRTRSEVSTTDRNNNDRDIEDDAAFTWWEKSRW